MNHSPYYHCINMECRPVSESFARYLASLGCVVVNRWGQHIV